MGSLERKCARQGKHAVEFVIGFLSLSCLAVAQSSSSKASPAVLSRKEAASLVLTQVRPEYPPLAKINYIQGRVRLQLLVSAEGKVTEANVVEGHPFLAVAALNAVRRWTYKPFLNTAIPTPFVTIVEVNFSLRNIQPEKFPPQPIKDLNRQVRPPHLLDKPTDESHLVHMRVLVSDEGLALDVDSIDFPAHYNEAMRMAGHHKFEPAHWGTMTVPWYLDVEVPVEGAPSAATHEND